jgi:hypothetical protein
LRRPVANRQLQQQMVLMAFYEKPNTCRQFVQNRWQVAARLERILEARKKNEGKNRDNERNTGEGSPENLSARNVARFKE